MSVRSILATTAVLSAALLARADPVPNTPDTGITGQTCTITWAEDTTGNWTDTAIELMTGDNQAMVHLTTVTTLDSSKSSSYSWTCPEVTINSAIYFYQFSAAGQTLTWTTRFALAAADGTTTTEPNATQPDGSAIPWGTGALVDPSTAVAAPSWLSSTDSTTAASAATSATAFASGAAGSTSASASASASATTGASTSSAATSATSSSSTGLVKVNTASAAASSAASTPGSAASSQSTDTSSAAALRVPAVVALSAIAGVFAYAL